MDGLRLAEDPPVRQAWLCLIPVISFNCLSTAIISPILQGGKRGTKVEQLASGEARTASPAGGVATLCQTLC